MTLYTIETGNFKLDGGAMFGVVPKPLWEKTNPADAKNRIKMAARSLLIEDGDKLILIDTGMGNKQSEKFFSYYDLWGDHSLEQSLRQHGFHVEDITDVILTHLHFDHCGGAISRRKDGLLAPTFPNARFWCHEKHWEWAIKPNPREKASFLPENMLPLQESGQLHFIKGKGPELTTSAFPFDFLVVDGHTESQLLPKLTHKGHTLVFAADLIPTAGHVPIPYVMGYDTRPLLTMIEKQKILTQASKQNWLFFLEHDPENVLLEVHTTDRGVRAKATHDFDTFFS